MSSLVSSSSVDGLAASRPKLKVLCPATSKKLSKLSERAQKSTKSFAVQELITATGNFSPSNVIGEGGFGLVYRGTLSTGQEVAIKHAHKDAKQGLEEFYNGNWSLLVPMWLLPVPTLSSNIVLVVCKENSGQTIIGECPAIGPQLCSPIESQPPLDMYFGFV